jgi:hypothetical protein
MIYYEMNKAVADDYYNGVRYWAATEGPDLNSWGPDLNSWVPVPYRPYGANRTRLLQHSERVWQETDDTVKFIKHRDTGIMTPIDMREFFLVKLRARNI